jgi:GNAT superfamily N-acetyltransferase
MEMNEDAKPTLSQERLDDLRGRRSEAANVLAEALLDMWRKEQRAKRSGAWPPPTPESTPAVASEPPASRAFRDYDPTDAELVRSLLEETWFSATELEGEPAGGQRHRVVLTFGRTRLGIAILDVHGEVAVLRAIAIRPSHRRRRHGTALAEFVIRVAHALGVVRLYTVAASPWFVEEVGFEFRDRALLPADVLMLPGLAEVPSAATVFELVPTRDGRRELRRMVPTSALEVLAQVPEVKAGRRPGRPRKQKGHEHAAGGDE